MRSGAERAVLIPGVVDERAMKINVSTLCDEPSNAISAPRTRRDPRVPRENYTDDKMEIPYMISRTLKTIWTKLG